MAIIFSYLFLNNYRSIGKREISFDHRYRFEEATNTVKIIKESDRAFGSYFYGKNIYSTTCLVGKNGEGKTSCIDFLRDSFALIKFNLDSGILSYEKDNNGVVSLPNEELRRYHLDREIRFLVIFKNEDTDYYVTNMDGVQLDEETANYCHAYIPKREEGDIDYRVAYFSMMRLPQGVTEQQRAFIRESEDGKVKGEYFGRTIHDIQTLSEQYMYDFSEESLNGLRERGDRGFNADLLMQMALFYSEKNELLENVLGKDYEGRIELVTVEAGEERINIKALAENTERMNKLVLDVLKEPTAYFWPFSSGQYSRFAFLARLYWFMGGGRHFLDSDRLKNLIARSQIVWGDKNSFKPMEYFLLNSDSVVLLIDEGELYYHPEWQRRFVKDVFDIIGGCDKKVDVQVVFTTSSTFMLSDILREDVVVLSKPNPAMKDYLDEDIQTFGQNIHMLLANRFFMDSTIGERAERLITGLFEMLSEKKEETPDEMRRHVQKEIREMFPVYIDSNEFTDADYDKFVHKLIVSIGEDFYRRQLLGMFEEYKRKTSGQREKEKQVLQILEKMKKDGNIQKEDLQQAMELLGG